MRSEDQTGTPQNIESEVIFFNEQYSRIESELGNVMVGMNDIIRKTLTGLFAGGHVLLEGVPGLGKTLLVKSIATALGLSFKRIQFTPDLMPSDVTGTQVLTEDESRQRSFKFKPGPLFANIVLADEINRATPKTQSALLEAMEEKQITVLGETHVLSKPFFVLATQNPIELEGTYPLPEAQLDRFLMKLLVFPPTSSQLKEVLDRTTGAILPEIKSVYSFDEGVSTIERMRKLVREVVVADHLKDILVRILSAVTPESEYATEKTKHYVRFGPGPRGAQAVVLSAKVAALLDSRINLAFDDIKEVVVPALRHRLILNFQAEADAVTADDILEEVRNAR